MFTAMSGFGAQQQPAPDNRGRLQCMQRAPKPVSHTFPAAYALQLVALVERFRIAPDALLSGTGYEVRDLETPGLRMEPDELIQLMERTRSLTGEPGIGFYLGLQRRVSMYGHMGFAVMHASLLGEAIDMFVRYTPTLTTALSLQLLVDGDRAVVEVEEHVDMRSAHDIAVFSMLVGVRNVIGTLIGRSPTQDLVDIPLKEPSYFRRFAHLLPEVRFEQPRVRMHFAAEALKAPLVTPDRAALMLARATCERQLAEMGFERSLASRVRQLVAGQDGLGSIDEVARALGMSTRTLKRRLAEEGTRFSDVLDAERYQRALDLLRVPELTMDDIAQQLRYSSATNFARAFRRWTGVAPTHYRRRRRATARP